MAGKNTCFFDMLMGHYQSAGLLKQTHPGTLKYGSKSVGTHGILDCSTLLEGLTIFLPSKLSPLFPTFLLVFNPITVTTKALQYM